MIYSFRDRPAVTCLYKRLIMGNLVDVERKALLDLANEARRRAYAPYSNYAVGAALRTRSGKIFTGCNVENAAYPTSMCAERVAIYKAVSEGEKDFEVIAVVTANGGSPCGGCRQVMSEFGLDTLVLIGDDQGRVIKETTVADLLPEAFTPRDLKK
jgi:cytidine deaminase